VQTPGARRLDTEQLAEKVGFETALRLLGSLTLKLRKQCSASALRIVSAVCPGTKEPSTATRTPASSPEDRKGRVSCTRVRK
jgi:hypothetical protein